MIQLTPELHAYSRFALLTTTDPVDCESRKLNFNLARRSGIIINSIESEITLFGYGVLGGIWGVSEVDLDPDNLAIWTGRCTGDDVEYDSSRLLIHRTHHAGSVATDISYSTPQVDRVLQDWRAFPMKDRPISITPLSHHFCVCTDQEMQAGDSLVCIRYMIVELTLEELGILNASRR